MAESVDYSLRDAFNEKAIQKDASAQFSTAIPDEDGVQGMPPWRSIPLWVCNDGAGMYFEIYRTDECALTSVLRGGGDWFWRLCSSTGTVQALSTGHSSRLDCLTAIEFLRRGARSAELRQP